MNFYSPRIFWFALLFGSLDLVHGAQAQTLELAEGIACNTQAQMERVIQTGDRDKAIAEVNEEARTPACGMVRVVFVRGDEISKVEYDGVTYAVLEITVIGADIGSGFVPVTPTVQYVAMPTKEIAV